MQWLTRMWEVTATEAATEDVLKNRCGPATILKKDTDTGVFL